ncbi:MAG: type IIL restriction-modification enzyme MmeI [Pseudolabrys sp.]
MREALGDATVDAIWTANPQINESADFVMLWWDRAANILVSKHTLLRRFGFVTTNSISQVFNRRVIERFVAATAPLSIVFAIPDHPWTKATRDAAAVRIAMTVASAGKVEGVLREVTKEEALNSDQPKISFKETIGKLNSDLTLGADATSVRPLKANDALSCNGMMLAGRGFVLEPSAGQHLQELDQLKDNEIIRPYINGGDLVRNYHPKLVIDFYSCTEEQARRRAPHTYSHLLSTVKPERGLSRDVQFRSKWWLFGRQRPDIRLGNEKLRRFIATTETSKHRIFQFLESAFVPDHMIIAISLDDAFCLGVLSSGIHCLWALRAGGWLGVGNDPRYSKSKVFDPFPFPSAGEILKAKIRAKAEELDAFRKARQKDHPDLTLTQIYNVLEKLKAIEARQTSPSPRHSQPSPPGLSRGSTTFDSAAKEDVDGRDIDERSDAVLRTAMPAHDEMNLALTPAEEEIKDKGLILILKELHEKLDALVFEAYGWPQSLTDEQILEKLVALNHQRAAEERRGHVRWLRPDYQIPRFGKTLDKMAAKEEGAQVSADLGLPAIVEGKTPFPSGAVEQTAAVFAALANAAEPMDAAAIAATFRKKKDLEKSVGRVLGSLARLGHVTSRDGKSYALRRAA